ncbi:MAG: IS66 family transposase [Bryobacteraceae bacterium]
MQIGAGQKPEIRLEYDLFLKSLNPLRRIQELAQEVRRTREERDQAQRRIGQLEEESHRLHQQMERLEEENKRLRKELEAAQRAARRQAAPFSRGRSKSEPKAPGRKPGAAYGQHHRRPVPDHVDEEITVAVPEQCPDCGGPLTIERVEPQYQEEIVRRTWVRRFHIPICRCTRCHNRVQGRHPMQTSDALGAAAAQVGPEAVTLGVLMNKSLGLPHADAAAILKQGFALRMSRGGICRAIQRVARKAEATWHALREAARRSALAHMDETGWKVEAQLHWLWAVVTEQVTFCEIRPGRGFAEAAEILGAEYAGWLIHDGLQLYYKFLKAAHQSCVAHLIRRCRDLAEVAPAAAARFPLAVKQMLEEGLALRDRYLEHKISLHGLWTATGRLEAKLDRLLGRNYRDPANRRLAKHLRHERPYLFTFLYCPGLVDATNNLAERVMRTLVVIRKNWGGNRTENGARVQAVLTSVLCTARQQDKDVFQLLTDLLRSPQPKLLDLLPKSVAGSEAAAASGGRPTEAGPPERGLAAETCFPGMAGVPVREWLPAAEAVPIFSSA